MSLYAQCFWDSNIASSRGFDILVEQISKNFEILSTIINLIEHKVSSDDLHGRAQAKIAKSYTKPDKSSKNDEVVKTIAEKIEKEANERILQCERIKTDVIDRLKEFMKTNYEKFKKAKTECSKSNKDRKASLENALKSIKNLNSKIKAHETLVKKLSVTEDEKNKVKISKSHAGVKSSEKDMITAISNLNIAIDSWKSQMVSFCNTAEELVLAFHSNVKQSLEHFSNILTEFSSTYKAIQGEFKDIANDLNPQMISEQFAKEKQTNETLPALAFTQQKNENGIVEYYLDFANDLSVAKKHIPFSESIDNVFKGTNSGSIKSSNYENTSKADSDSYFDSASAQPSSGPSMSGYVIAQYDYAAQADDELSFFYGDRIKIIFKEDESWYMGEMDNGTRGIFPITYVTPE